MAGHSVLKTVLIALVRFYRYTFSAFFGNQNRCRFEPTCSSYAITALKEYGSFKGVYLTTRRLLRCHPWHAGGYDPVP